MNQIQLNNLITLRDSVFPIVFEMEKGGRVDLDVYESECGTAHCVLGWYVHEIEQVPFSKSRFHEDPVHEAKEEFGILESQYDPLFGSERHGTLQERYDYLCEIINNQQKE